MPLYNNYRNTKNWKLSSSQGVRIGVQRSTGRGSADRLKDPGSAAHCAGEETHRTFIKLASNTVTSHFLICDSF